MPTTRSASRAATNAGVQAACAPAAPSREKSNNKRGAPAETEAKQKKKRNINTKAKSASTAPIAAVAVSANVIVAIRPPTPPTFLPAVLSFSFEDAKSHLINVDPRFEDVFDRLKCRPFEHLERLDPFRTLTASILGQQISWRAARSITHRFIRLYNPSLPEEPPAHGDNSFFPSAHQVCQTDVANLRTAGLSGRKAEYVLDLASRFADGRLTAEKIHDANDEELSEMLIAVRGIGQWTVDMFAIFSLRRPNILPVGDLGVQRGVARWFLSLHSPKNAITISPHKLPKAPTDSDDADDPPGPTNQAATDADGATVMVSTGDEAAAEGSQSQPSHTRALTPDVPSVPPAPVPSTPVKRARADAVDSGDGADDLHAPPPAFTPSINRTLNKALPGQYQPPPLPSGLTVEALKARLNGKNKIKGALLTPKEMEELTASWKPYRSLGVYYMWALAEDKSS